MTGIKTQGHINSLGGKMADITVLEKKDGNNYIVDYRGMKCTAIFNYLTFSYYVDDVYGIVKESN